MGDVGTLDTTIAVEPAGETVPDQAMESDQAVETMAPEPDTVAVDPKALAELMPAFERLIRIGVYYPTGHPCCDLAASAVRSAIQLVVGKAPDLQIEVQGNALFVQGLDLDPEWRGVAGFKQLLDEVGIVDMAIDPDISAEDLHQLVTRLLEIRQEVRSARSFSQFSVEGLPSSVRVRDREFLARRKEVEKAYEADDDGAGPGLESLMTALQGHGLNRRQLALCQRFLEALPKHLENHRLTGSALPQSTWADVESLLIKAVRQRSFERSSGAAQQMAIRKNLGSLISLFEEIGDDSASENWGEAVDLLLSINQRPTGVDMGEAMGDGRMDPDADDSDAEAELRELLGNLPVTDAPGPVQLLPGDHREELSVLLQVLQQEQPVSSVARMQRRLREILQPPLSDDELMAVAGGIRSILEQPDAEYVEMQAALVMEILRKAAPDAPPRLVCALSAALPTARRSALWTFAINELLMAGSAVPVDQHQVLVDIVVGIPVEDIARLTPRIERLEALRDRRTDLAAARRLPGNLFPHFASLFETSGKQALGEWVLEALRQAPPCRTTRAVLPLLDKVRPAHREFLVAALRQEDDAASSGVLDAGAAIILRDELPDLDRDKRHQDWVISAIKLVGALDLPEAESILEHVRSERRWFILPAWPGDLRRIAAEILDKRRKVAA